MNKVLKMIEKFTKKMRTRTGILIVIVPIIIISVIIINAGDQKQSVLSPTGVRFISPVAGTDVGTGDLEIVVVFDPSDAGNMLWPRSKAWKIEVFGGGSIIYTDEASFISETKFTITRTTSISVSGTITVKAYLLIHDDYIDYLNSGATEAPPEAWYETQHYYFSAFSPAIGEVVYWNEVSINSSGVKTVSGFEILIIIPIIPIMVFLIKRNKNIGDE